VETAFIRSLQSVEKVDATLGKNQNLPRGERKEGERLYIPPQNKKTHDTDCAGPAGRSQNALKKEGKSI